MNITEQITNFLKYLSLHGVSSKSLKYYKSDLVNFLNWTGDKKVDNKLIHEYIGEIKKTTPLSTLNRRLSTLRSYSSFLGKDFMEGIENQTNFRKIIKTWQEEILFKFEHRPKIKSILNTIFFSRPKWYKKYHSFPLASYIHIAILILFTTISGYAFYDQVFYSADRSLAFPTALTRPNRYLSFQGRLTDNLGNPETAATNMVFQLYSVSTGGSALWNSGTCSITPDQDGIFSTLLGSSCGSEIASSVFSENAAIWLGTTIGADAEATPRVQIATVAYALNAETLQGFPAGTGTSTIPYINSSGSLVLANASPKIQSTSGTFAVEGQALTITTPNTSNGIITINPDGTGTLDLTFEGAAPGASANGFVNATNANITSGSLYSGTVASNAAGYNFINFLSGSSPTSKFSIDYAGNVIQAGDLTISGGNINTGNIAFTIGDATTDSITFLTDGTGNGEIVLPDDSIGPNELLSSGQTDEYCLTYEASGTTLEWQTCGAGGGSLFTDSGTITYLTATADDFAIGGSTLAASMFSIDESSGNFYFGSDNSANPILNFEATDGDAGEFGFSTSDSFYLTNANLGIGTTSPTENLTVLSNNSQDLFGVYDGANNPNLVISAGGGVTFKNSAFDAVYQFNGVATYTDRTTVAKQTGGGSYTVFAVEATSNDEFYLGLDHPFDSFDVWIGTAGVGVTLTGRYWNGSAWTSVTLTDGTSNLTSDGTVTFTVPSDWATNSVNGTTKYWLDLRSAGTNISTAPTIHAITPGGNVRWQYFTNAGDTNPVISSNRYGTIGVGTTSQQNLFEITDPKQYNVPSLYDKVWAYPLVLSNKDNTNNSGTGIAFLDSDGLSNVGSSIVFKRTGSNSQGELIFYTKQSTTSGVAPVQAMVINNAGNIGVGSTGPDARIDSLATTGEQLRLTYSDGSVYSGFTVNSSGYLTIDPTGSRVALDGSLQVGSTSALAYSRFGTATTTHGLSASNEVLLSDDLEVDAILYLDGGIIANSAGTASIILSSTPTTLPNTLTASNWLVENSTNVGQSALMVNQQKSGDLFTASASGTTKFTIHADGAVTLASDIASTSNTQEGTIFYDNNSAGSSSSDHLFLRGSDGAWHRIATDMTKYSTTNASVTNQNYIEIAHNQNTNDLNLTGWVYDTVTSLWKRITDWSTTTTHDLDNEFNSSFTQKSKAGTIALNSTYVYGTGTDGAISITADTNINTANSISGRSCADGGDAVNYSVTALTSTTATLSSTPSTGCLSVGDEILLINLQGTSTKFINVGNYETLRIRSISTSNITFTKEKIHYYGDDAGTDTNIGTSTSNQRVMLQRVPNYTNVTLSNAGTDFVPSAWSAPKGGVMFFRATGTVTIPTGTTINANALGYNNGTAGSSGVAATGGEAFCAAAGTAGGSGGDSDNTPADTAGVCGGGGGGGANSAAGGNAGSAGALGGAGGAGGNAGSTAAGNGYGAGGAGGGYGAGGNGGAAGGGTASAGGNGGTYTSGTGGTGVFTTPTAWAGGGGGGGSYGDAYLNQIYMGSGGAGGGRGDSNATATDTPVNGGAGGKGGGIVILSAATFSVTSTGGIQANGAAGSDAANTTYAGGGGGGAGGSIKIVADTVTTSTTDLITAAGGNGATTGTGADGGAGGVGRIAISYKNTITANSAQPDFPTAPYLEESGYYGIFVSKEINTPGATSLTSFNYTETLNTYGQAEVQTRTGATNDSTDGTWEAWKPVVATTNIKSLNAMDATGDWTVTNLNAAADGQLARNVDYFEDEDITNAANKSVKFGSVGSSAGYAEDTITSTDLSNFDLISAWVYATASGEIKLGIGESAATEQTETITIDAANTWQKIYWDISDIANSSKNAITKLRVYLPSPNQTVYIDSLQSEELITGTGAAPSSTANSYFQYRFILTSTNGQSIPSVTGFTLTYNNGSSQTIDASSVRNENGSDYYSSTHLTISESTLSSIKNFNVDVSQTGVTQNGDYDPGTGADGDITISSNTSINTANSIAGRSCVDGGDAVNYSVSALTQTTATLTTNPSTPSCLQAGDEILLINLQGTSGSTVNVGNYETLRISSISGNTITFTKGKGKYYGDGTGDDTNLGTGVSNQKVMLQRVPNYSNVTVNSSVTFSPDAYDYTTGQGGVMFFRSTGTVTSAGTISATGKGYLGGTGASSYLVRSTPGQSLFYTTGLDGQGGIGSVTDPNRQGQNGTFSGGGGGGKITTTAGGTAGTGVSSSSAGGGGAGGSASRYSGVGSEHGYGGGGGGGGYVTGGGGGQSLTNAGDGTTSTSGAGVAATNSGNTNRAGGGGGGAGGYGDANLAKLMLGSGGGGGGAGQLAASTSYFGGDGGEGGGIILIAANNITISGSAQSNGGDGTTGDNVYGSGGGAGAGGSVKLLGRSLTLGSSLVTASAGAVTTDDTYDGGTGSVGRVAVYYADSISGSTSPASSTAQIASYDYSLFISDEIPTPNATGYNKIKWLANLDSFGKIELQTRSGRSSNSTDGTWEAWKPVVATTNIKSLNAMDATGDWTVTNLNAAADGQLARNVDYFEDEDITNAANKSVKFGSVGSSSGYAEDTITSTDLSSSDYFTAWVYATSSGNLVKFGFGESNATEQEKTFTIQASNTWQKIYWDISDISSSARDAITKLRVTLLSTNTTLYVDSLSADRYLTNSNGATISSTPNEYLQYRAVLTTTNNGYHPTLHNVQVDWSNGFKVVQTDANTVRLYNFTGDTQQLRLDVVVFGADLAEWYTVDSPNIEAGNLVSLTGNLDEFGVPILTKSNGINDKNVVGVISTKAGQTLGIEAENRKLLGLAGRVPVQIDTNSNNIKVGDELTSSSVPGLATLAMPGDRTIGKSTESWTKESGKNNVLIIIDNSYAPNPTTFKSQVYRYIYDTKEIIDETTQRVVTQVGVFAMLISPEIKTNIISPVADSNLIIDLDPENATSSSMLAIQGIEDKVVATIDATGKITANELSIVENATISGTLYADKIESTKLNEIEDLLKEVELNQQLLADAVNWTSDTATESAEFNNLISNSLQTTNLFVTGQTAITSLFVSDNLSTSRIDSLETPLQIQSLAASPLEIMAGKIIVDTNGDTKFLGNVEVAGDLKINGLVVANTPNLIEASESAVINTGEVTSNSTAGKATLAANSEQIRIINNKVNQNTLIYITPITSTQNKVLFVKSKDDGYFDVGFSEVLDTDVEFNWWIIRLQ